MPLIGVPKKKKRQSLSPINQDDDDGDADGDGSDILSTLDPRVQDLVQMIFDKKMMANTVAAMNYDIKKQPLGKLASKTIKVAFKILKEIEDILKVAPGNKSSSAKVVDLTNRFYTYIPHNVGMQRLPYIDNLDILKEKLQLLQVSVNFSLFVLETNRNFSMI